MSITLYTTNTCAYCVMVKKWLGAKGYTYEEVNVDQYPDKQQEAFELSGQLAVPVTIIKKGKERSVVVGYNLARLAKAIA